MCVALGVWDEVPGESVPQDAEEAGAALSEAEAAAGAATQRAATKGVGDRIEGDDDELVTAHEEADTESDVSRDSVVARLTKRLTDFVRTHEGSDAADRDENAFLHNEDVDSDPENTGDAREAADTLRRRSRILKVARPARDDPRPSD